MFATICHLLVLAGWCHVAPTNKMLYCAACKDTIVASLVEILMEDLHKVCKVD